MALASLNTAIPWPHVTARLAGSPSISTIATLDAAGEYAGVVTCAREALTVSHVGFRTGAVSGSPTIDVRIESVGTDGLPSGTLFGTDTNIVTGALSANTFALHALTASASIPAGTIFAVKLAYDSGTSVVVQQITNLARATGVPYSIVNTGTPTKAILNSSVNIALGSGTTTFYGADGAIPATAVTNGTFNNTDGARRGVRFQVPFPCRCAGMRVYEGAQIGDKNVILFNDAGTELSSSSTAFDGDMSANNATGCQNYYFDNPVTLSPGTWYRAVVEPSSTTNCGVSTLTLPSADYRTAMPGGTNYHYTTYASSAWDDTATSQVPLIDLLIDQLDDGTGGGATGGAHILGGTVVR